MLSCWDIPKEFISSTVAIRLIFKPNSLRVIATLHNLYLVSVTDATMGLQLTYDVRQGLTVRQNKFRSHFGRQESFW